MNPYPFVVPPLGGSSDTDRPTARIMLILNDEQMLDLEEINATAPENWRLDPIRLPDGRHALDADLLTICDPSEPWRNFRTLLIDLPSETITTFAKAA